MNATHTSTDAEPDVHATRARYSLDKKTIAMEMGNFTLRKTSLVLTLMRPDKDVLGSVRGVHRYTCKVFGLDAIPEEEAGDLSTFDLFRMMGRGGTRIRDIELPARTREPAAEYLESLDAHDGKLLVTPPATARRMLDTIRTQGRVSDNDRMQGRGTGRIANDIDVRSDEHVTVSDSCALPVTSHAIGGEHLDGVRGEVLGRRSIGQELEARYQDGVARAVSDNHALGVAGSYMKTEVVFFKVSCCRALAMHIRFVLGVLTVCAMADSEPTVSCVL